MRKFDFYIRLLSVAPVLASAMLTTLLIIKGEIFSTWYSFTIMLLTLGILPLSAYPLQKYIPNFKDKGRAGQRSLAMLFAVFGYILCAIGLLIVDATLGEWLISLTYLVSGILILMINKLLKIHVSGHGCGTLGPMSLLIIFSAYVPAIIYLVISALSCFSSLRSGRHTLPQFIGGALVSILTAFSLAFIIFL